MFRNIRNFSGRDARTGLVRLATGLYFFLEAAKDETGGCVCTYGYSSFSIGIFEDRNRRIESANDSSNLERSQLSR